MSAFGRSGNPLITPSPLPYQAPPFDQITDRDFAPAFEQGMTEQLAEVDAIVNNPAPPTFENTLAALERSGQTLTRVHFAFNALSSANTNDALQQLQEAIAPKLAAHADAIVLNPGLFKRIETLHSHRDRLVLDPEARRLLEYQHQQFVMAGARLSPANQAQLKALNQEDASLSAKFTNQLLAAAKDAALVIADRSELDGLSSAEIDAAALAATERDIAGRWVLAVVNTTQQPALESLTHRPTREKLFRASCTRAERGDANDTRAAITRLAEIRAHRAQLLGHSSYAAWRLQDQMAGTSEAVEAFLARLVPAATARARREAADIQSLIDRHRGGFHVEPWDWDFYAEQVRKARYDFEAHDVKPYFELNRVLIDGVFYAATRLYGVTFTERHDLPVYHPDVRVFEVFDHDGAPLGLFYVDYFKRDNKNGGAWMDNLVTQSTLLGTKPVITNVGNFPKPAAGQPALISFDDVITMFHEFGHALHGFFADQMYPALSGTAVARDFVELPPQFNEHWALDPQVLARYALHHESGEPMPPALVDKMRQAATFNQGYALTEILAAVRLDMAWHSLPATAPIQDADVFEASSLAAAGLNLPEVPPRYRSSYFLHIWANGYAAGYYAYLWTEMLEEDAYAWFEEHGGLTRANGQRFRDLILSKGNTEDYATMFRNFRGREPQIDAMLARRGLKTAAGK